MPNDYRFSRTYEQFWHDIRKKVYDEINIDDARDCTIRACEMLREVNRRAKLFVCPSLIGKPGYCNWADLRKLSEYHDIENHSFEHIHHKGLPYEVQYENIAKAQTKIFLEIGKKPRYFVAPYNEYDLMTDRVVRELELQSVKDRENMLNFSK